MGVVNVTPDSFSDGGRFLAPEHAVAKALELVAEGADILDIGGESSRPGARPVSAAEEIFRVQAIIEEVCASTSALISIDTYKSEVAEVALSAGAHIVNDISAFRLDERMPGVINRFSAGIVLMHMRGRPETMQQIPPSDDIVSEVIEGLNEALERALQAGIRREQIVADPGIGFGKTAEDNLILLNHLEKLSALGVPLLIGTSRKSFIGKILNAPVTERIIGSVATEVVALLNGAHIIRVHDVIEARQAADMIDAILEAKQKELWV